MDRRVEQANRKQGTDNRLTDKANAEPTLSKHRCIFGRAYGNSVISIENYSITPLVIKTVSKDQKLECQTVFRWSIIGTLFDIPIINHRTRNQSLVISSERQTVSRDQKLECQTMSQIVTIPGFDCLLKPFCTVEKLFPWTPVFMWATLKIASSIFSYKQTHAALKMSCVFRSFAS